MCVFFDDRGFPGLPCMCFRFLAMVYKQSPLTGPRSQTLAAGEKMTGVLPMVCFRTDGWLWWVRLNNLPCFCMESLVPDSPNSV